MTTKKQPKVKQIKSIQDLMPDDNNLNKGTERGRYMLEKSLEQNGAGRSILVDRDGRVIAGNKTLEVAGQMGIDEIVVIPSDGKKLVVVQRTDLSMDDPDDKRARVLAYADNRVAQVDLGWNPKAIIKLSQEVGLGDYIKDDELRLYAQKALSDSIDAQDMSALLAGLPSLQQENMPEYKKVIIHFANETDYKKFAKLIGQTMTDKTTSIWYPALEHDKNKYKVE